MAAAANFSATASGSTSNTNSSTTQTTSTLTLTAMSANTLMNGVSTSNAINDPTAPDLFSIDFIAMQDAYFGTIAIADINVGDLPHCLLESAGVFVENPPPGCQGGLHVPVCEQTGTCPPSCEQTGTCPPPCLQTGTCNILSSGSFNPAHATAQANVFKRRHFVRPMPKPLAPAHVEFPAPAQMLKYLQGSKLPSDKLAIIQKALNPQSLAPPSH